MKDWSIGRTLSRLAGGEFARDPGLLPGLIMFVSLMLCAAYLTMVIYRISYGRLVGDKFAFTMVWLVAAGVLLGGLFLVGWMLSWVGLDVSDAECLGLFPVLILLTIGLRRLLRLYERHRQT